MKKILIVLTIMISCLGITKVNAETVTFSLDEEEITLLNKVRNDFGIDNFNLVINELLDIYKNDYMSVYPYYSISIDSNISNSSYPDSDNYLEFGLAMYSNVPSIEVLAFTSQHSGFLFSTKKSDISHFIIRKYQTTLSDGSLNENMLNYTLVTDVNQNSNLIFSFSYDNSSIYESSLYPFYYISNFDLNLSSIKGTTSYSTLKNSRFDSFRFPKLDNPTLYSEVAFDGSYVFEPYYLYDKDSNVTLPNMTEINLNDYAYVALAPKEFYSEEKITTVYVKGQYCLTPVYNYGMTERKEILTGSQVERCSPYYDNYTPVRTYLLNQDMQNHAIYYLKSYDTERDNYVKIDNTVFDISYITEEEKDNPYVTIDGKEYPTIPYDKLTDTATKSEDEGYVSGSVEKFEFSDIFTAPLNFLKDVWTSIISVFSLITELLSLLPPVMQNFFYASFMLAVVIGLIKIIL